MNNLINKYTSSEFNIKHYFNRDLLLAEHFYAYMQQHHWLFCNYDKERHLQLSVHK